MPTFPTPNPIIARLDVVGNIRITASDRIDTTAAVHPGDPAKPADIRAAEQATIEFDNGTLTVTTKHWKQYTPWGGKGMVNVTIELPTGSQITAATALGNFVAEGELGDCRIKTAKGDLRLDHTGALSAVTAYGNIAADRVTGDADLSTGSGLVQLGVINGTAEIRNANGNTNIADARGELRVKAANGGIVITRAHGTVVAKTANGSIRIAEVVEGSLEIETAAGELAVGVSEGTAAWLDVVTRFGAVHNTLETIGGPPTDPLGPTVRVHARTSIGDILIARSVTAIAL